MNRILIAFLLLTIGLGYYSCKEKAIDNAQHTIIQIEEINNFDNFLNKFSFLEAIPLETKDECLIGEVTDLFIDGDRLFVLDSHYAKALFCFSMNGKFLFKIDQVGKGPGEFIQPTCAWISSNSNHKLIVIHDGFTKKNLQYNYSDGSYIETKITGNRIFLNCKKINNSLICQQSWNGLKHKDRLMIFEIPTLKMSYIGLESKSDFDLFYTSGSLSKNYKDEHILFTTGFEDVIYTISSEGVSPGYFVDFGEKSVPKNIKRSFRFEDESIEQYFNESKGKYFCWISNLCETESQIIFSFTDLNNNYASFYNKHTFECMSYKFPNVDLHLSSNIFPCPYTTTGDTLISYMSPEVIGSYEKYIPINAREVKTSDNPIIVKYK